jgi:hypothetical protein
LHSKSITLKIRYIWRAVKNGGAARNKLYKPFENEIFEKTVTVKTADFLKSKNTEILKIIERTEELALTIQKQPPEYVWQCRKV